MRVAPVYDHQDGHIEKVGGLRLMAKFSVKGLNVPGAVILNPLGLLILNGEVLFPLSVSRAIPVQDTVHPPLCSLSHVTCQYSSGLLV